MAPPAAPAREGRLYEEMQYTLRGPTLAALPFFDRDKVVALLDELPSLDEGGRTAYDPALMILLSPGALHAGYGLSGDGHAFAQRANSETRLSRAGQENGAGASSRPCDARSLSWRMRNRSCTVGTTHRTLALRRVGCTHLTVVNPGLWESRKSRRPESREEEAPRRR